MQDSNFKTKKISIIIVNYRSDKYLQKCIASLFNFEKPEHIEVIIVNNDDENKLKNIKQMFPQIRIIEAKKNLGFGAAVNLGAQSAVGYVLFFLNPDSEIKGTFFNEVIEEFNKNNQTAVLGPKILEEDGSIQKWTFGKKMNIWRLFLNNIGFSSFNENKIDWVGGAGMFIRKEDFEKVGGFDENFFMYFEDMDLCLRIKKIGKKIIYFPVVEIMHLGSGSEIEEKQRKKEYFISQDYYFQKNLGYFQSKIIRIIRRLFIKYV